MEALVIHWIYLVADVEAVPEGCRWEICWWSALFYAYDNVIASNHTEWLQGDFDALAGIFDWVGLRTNVGNTVGMICKP